MIALVFFLFGFVQLAFAKVVHYDWDITWVTAAPDGYPRRVIGINGQWPCPQVNVNLGDRLIVQVHNKLGDQSTSIHWHGLFQRGSADMDGSSGATQCPIAPGQTFTYDFTVNQVGTYWYHSHNLGQYPDGLWGPFIVHDPHPPFHFDEEITFTLLDWYHDEMPGLIHTYQSPSGEAADGTPVPSSALMNAGMNITIPVKPNKTYYVHIICPGNYPGHAWFFDQHPMTTVEVDGVYVEPTLVNVGTRQARIATGQRQGVLIKTKNDTSQNYAIFDTMDINMLFFNKGQFPPKGYNTNVTGWLVYDEKKPLPPPPVLYSLENSDFIDDLQYVPIDHEPAMGPVGRQIIMETNSANISGISRFVINNSTYIGQKVPSLYSALTVGEDYHSNPLVYGHVNPYVLQHNEVIEIVINNRQSNLHPWHLHGHNFQVLERTAYNTGPFSGQLASYNPSPNARVWLFHCHIEFHVMSGFSATFIEAPDELASSGLKIPHNHLEVCEAYPQATAGNAAGNTKNPLDLTGSTTEVTAGGYGAVYPPTGSISGRKRGLVHPHSPRA